MKHITRGWFVDGSRRETAGSDLLAMPVPAPSSICSVRAMGGEDAGGGDHPDGSDPHVHTLAHEPTQDGGGVPNAYCDPDDAWNLLATGLQTPPVAAPLAVRAGVRPFDERPKISKSHEAILASRGATPSVLLDADVETVEFEGGKGPARLASFKIKPKGAWNRDHFPGLLFKIYVRELNRWVAVYRPATPWVHAPGPEGGRPRTQAKPERLCWPEAICTPYLAPNTSLETLREPPHLPLIIVDTPEKALAAEAAGTFAIALPSADAWGVQERPKDKRCPKVLHPVLQVAIETGREIFIAFPLDADCRKVAEALSGPGIAYGTMVYSLSFNHASDGSRCELDTFLGRFETREEASRALVDRMDDMRCVGPTLGEEAMEGLRRPAIVLEQSDHLVVDTVIKVLSTNDRFLRFGGRLSKVDVSEDGESVSIRPWETDELKHDLTRWARPMELSKEGDLREATGFSRSLASALMPGEWARVIYGKTQAPVFCPNGHASKPGYDRESRLWYVRGKGTPDMTLPEVITGEMAAESLGRIDDVFADFNFRNGHHEAGCLAKLFTIVGRPAFEGPAPGFLTSAPQRNVGKSMIDKAIILIALGHSIVESKWPPADLAEQRKAISTLLKCGARVGFFDNLLSKSVLGSPILDGWLSTETRWSDRDLGRLAQIEPRARAVALFGGNQITTGEDTKRRIIPSFLKAPVTGAKKKFRHPRLLKYVADNRWTLLKDVLILLRYWHLQGRPQHDRDTLESYDDWDALVRAAVVFYKGPNADPVLAQEDMEDSEDEVAEHLIALYQVIMTKQTVRADGQLLGVRAVDIIDAGFDDGGRTARNDVGVAFAYMFSGKKPGPKAFAEEIKFWLDRDVAGLMLTKHYDRNKVVRYCVVPAPNADDAEGTDASASLPF